MKGKQSSISEITVLLNGKQAEKAIEVLTSKIEALNNEKEKINAQDLFEKEDIERLKVIDKEISGINRTIKAMKPQMMDVGTVIKNIANVSEKDLGRALQKLTKQTKNLDRSTKEYAENKQKIALLRAEFEKINNEGKKNVNTFDQVGQSIKRLGAYVLAYAGFNELTSGLRKMFDMNIKLSDQLADIEKTTGITGKELAELSNDINSINTRTSVEQLNDLAAAAGKIGITGRDNVLQFVKAGNQINVALGEDLGEDAIKNIAKLNDVLGITKELGVEKALLSTGSAINELGQNSTASEAYLVDFGQRLGGIASQAGITMQQILALGSVTDQLGQNVEVSATALNKFITSIVANTDKVAKAIGVTGEELRSRLDKSTWEGLMFVLEKLNGKGGLAGLAPIMGDLGSDGARLTSVLAALAQNYKMLSSEVDLSNKAFADATSVVNETLKKENSLAGIVARISKNLTTAFQNSEFVSKFKDLALYVEEATSEFDDFGNKIRTASNILSEMVGWMIKLGVYLVQNIDWIARLAFVFSSLKIAIIATNLVMKAHAAWLTTTAAIQTTMTTSGQKLLIYFYQLTFQTGKANAAMRLFNLTTKANPWILAGTALVSLGTAIYGIYRSAGAANREMKAFQSTVNSNIASEQAQATYLFEAAMKAKEGTDERRKAIEELNSKYGEYLPSLLDEVTSTNDLKDALLRVNEALKYKIVMQMKQKDMEDITSGGITSQLNEVDAISKASTATEEMTQKMIMRAKELTDTYSSMGYGATETFLTVRQALEKEFGQVAVQSKEYWSSMNQYVLETISLRDKLAANEKKYSIFMPSKKSDDTVNSLSEGVEVVAPRISKSTTTDADRKKALQKQKEAIDLWLQQKKNALSESRLAEQDSNSESYISEQEYNKALESLEMEALHRRLAIIGLEPEETEKLKGQLLDIRQKMANDIIEMQKKAEEVILDANPLKKEESEYNERLKALGLFGVERENLTKEQLEALELLEKQHGDNILEIKRKERIRQLKLKEELFQSEFQNEKTSRGQEIQKEENQLNIMASLGGYTPDQEFSKRMEIQKAKIQLLYDELAVRREVGAETESINIAIARTEEETLNYIANQYKNKIYLYKQYGAQLGEALGQVLAGQEGALAGFGDVVVDILFDTLEKMVTAWVVKLTGAAIVNTAMITMESIGSMGFAGIAKAAILAGLITAAMAAAKSGLKSLIKGGKKDTSSSSPTTGNRVIKSSGFSAGGYSGQGGTYEVKGFVHGDEYVVPKWMMQNPIVFDTVRTLENIRQTRSQANPLPRQGYVEGGPVQTTIPVASGMDPEMKQIMKDTKKLLSDLNTNGVFTKFNISHFNEESSRYEASVKRGSRKS